MTIHTLNLSNSALSLQVNENFCPWRDSSSEQQWWKWPLFFLLFLVANICYGQTNTERGLVLYCPFSNSFDDQGPAKNTLAPHNVQFVEGIDGSGVSFNGKDSYLDILDNPSLNFDESDFSISFWLEFSYLPDGYALLLTKCNESTYPFRGISFFVGDLENGKMLFRTSGEYQLYAQSNYLNTSLWKYVVLLRREKYLEIYLDGELVSTSSFPLTNVTNKGNFRIGCNHIDPKLQRYNGKLDELRIYNRALSADEISELNNRHSSMGVVGHLTSFIGAYIKGKIEVIVAIVFAGILAFFYIRHKRSGLPFSLDTINSFGTGLKISLSLVYGLVIYLLIFPLTSTFTDSAFFGGDTWEYQSMAVNFAKGHGIQKFGQIEKFDQYKFDRQDESLLTLFENSSYDVYTGLNIGRNNFYRTPGYPLFIGIIYKLFGVSPWIAKQIQLILLIVISSFLPWIGTYFWGRTGFWSGFAAGVLYISMYYNSAEAILTEPLTSFSIFLVIIAFINFMKGKSTFLSCVLLGASLGLSLLVKGSLIFLPFLFAAGMLWQAYKQKSIELFKRLVIVGASLALTILPWSIYASSTNGHPIILSTQGEAVLLDGNNEYSTDGGWHPEWRSNQNHFYNREDVKNLSSPIRLIKFYASHREVLPKIFKYKVMRAFTPFYGLWIILILLIIDYWSSKIRQVSNFGYIIFMSISFLALLMFIALPFLQSSADKLFVLSRNNLNHNLFFYVILLGTLIALVIDRKARLSIKFPLILTIFFLNFLMLTLIVFGDPRFVAVMDFIFLLCAIQYLTLMLISFYKKGSAPGMNNSN